MSFQKGNTFGKAKNKNKGTVYHKFSRKDIAKLAGVKPRTISDDIYKKIDLHDLRQFVEYCYKRVKKS